MEYTLTINLFYVLWAVFFAVIFYIYMQDDGDDHLTHIRHDVEMKKEWFRMLAEQQVKNTTWPKEWTKNDNATL
jgi:Na+(H+)/acetate symporter ActP